MKITIIGAGIGGLTAALALSASGHEVAIYERGEAPASQGAGYVLWPNAMFVLEKMGLAARVRSVGGRLHSMDRLSQQGERLTRFDLDFLQELMGCGSYAILRKDLLQLLVQAVLNQDIALHFNHELSHFIPEDATQRAVVFKNGYSCMADLVIGADGRMNSPTRQFVSGANEPLYQGFVNWVGFVEHNPASNNPTNSNLGKVMDYWGVGERFGIVSVDSSKAYWAAGAALLKNQIPDNKNDLLARFAKWPREINQLIAATDPQQIKAIFVHDLEPQIPWYKDRALLLGDSAHACLPTSGQGACQAIEDAWHLTRCLEGCPAKDNQELTRRLENFQSIRFDKTTSITRSARHLARQIFSTDPATCAQRDRAARASNERAAVEGMAELWSWGLR